jgi:hypothetical protein
VLRLLQRPDDALRALEAGLALSAGFPLQRGQLHRELALVHAARGDREALQASARQAIELFAACAAPRLAEGVAADWPAASAIDMSPHVPWPPGPKPLT